MNIILLGPPGSGKGTQSKFIIERYKLCLVSLGEILRNNYSNNKKIKRLILNGNLINDNLAFSIIKNYINNNFSNNGYLFDGFPRNIIQANFLSYININYVIELCVSENILLNRLMNRKIHVKSGRIYNKKYNPPKVEGIDDFTGEKLVSRKDDSSIKIIKKRFLIYNKELCLLKNFYKKYFFYKKLKYGYLKVNANKNIYIIRNKIFNFLN